MQSPLEANYERLRKARLTRRYRWLPSSASMLLVGFCLCTLAGVLFLPPTRREHFPLEWFEGCLLSHVFFCVGSSIMLFGRGICHVESRNHRLVFDLRAPRERPPQHRHTPQWLLVIHSVAYVLVVAGNIHVLCHVPYYTEANVDVRSRCFVIAFGLVVLVLILECVLILCRRRDSPRQRGWQLLSLVLGIVGHGICMFASWELLDVSIPQHGNLELMRAQVVIGCYGWIGGFFICVVGSVVEYIDTIYQARI